MFRRVDTCNAPGHNAPEHNAPKHKLLTIELRDVVREYRVGGQTVRALDGISLRLEGGQFVSMVGPSGAGKSTLLHLLGALDSPDSGSISSTATRSAASATSSSRSFAIIASGSYFSSSTCCRPCRRGRTSRCRSCSTVSGWAKPSRTRFGCWSGSGSVTGPSTGRGTVRRPDAAGRGGAGIDDGPAADPRRRTNREPRFHHGRFDLGAAWPRWRTRPAAVGWW